MRCQNSLGLSCRAATHGHLDSHFAKLAVRIAPCVDNERAVGRRKRNALEILSTILNGAAWQAWPCYERTDMGEVVFCGARS